MNLFSLAYTVQITDESGFAERFTLGWQTMLFGMLVVFAVLILLWGILELFHFAFAKATGKPKDTPIVEKSKTIAPPSPTMSIPVASATQNVDDGALIAALTAALALTLDKPTTSFRVVSFRRTSKNTPWNQKNN